MRYSQFSCIAEIYTQPYNVAERRPVATWLVHLCRAMRMKVAARSRPGNCVAASVSVRYSKWPEFALKINVQTARHTTLLDSYLTMP